MPQKYRLQARFLYHEYSDYSTEDESIVTSMQRFYKSIDTEWGNTGYKGMVFVGVSFIDNKGNKIKSDKQNVQNYPRRSTLTKSLDVFGTETTSFSGWMPVVGPVKGSYLVKIGTDD